jgi:hypothetical protein
MSAPPESRKPAAAGLSGYNQNDSALSVPPFIGDHQVVGDERERHRPTPNPSLWRRSVRPARSSSGGKVSPAILRLLRVDWMWRGYTLRPCGDSITVVFPDHPIRPIALSLQDFEQALELSCEENKDRWGYLRLVFGAGYG